MAYSDFFGLIDNCLRVSPFGVLKHTVTGVGAGPIVIYAVGSIQVSITIFDVEIVCTATVGGGTFTIDTSIAPAGYVALTNAIVCAAQDVPTRAGTLNPAQATVGPADAIEVTKAAAANAGIVHILFFLT